jgi:hypothetical protein
MWGRADMDRAMQVQSTKYMKIALLYRLFQGILYLNYRFTVILEYNAATSTDTYAVYKLKDQPTQPDLLYFSSC